ncbi:CJ090 protein, partial [Amia calva]|nr:CJ090 protein [Amia calva]
MDIMEAWKLERATLSPETWRRTAWESAAAISSSPVRTSSADKRWDFPMSQVPVSPRTPRPRSCIESRELDGWQALLERPYRQASDASLGYRALPFPDSTVSLPVLHDEGVKSGPWHTGTPERILLRSSPHTGCNQRPASLCQESLHCGDFCASAPEPASLWERVHFRCVARKEHVRLCTSAAVKSGWLPIQRRAAVCVIPCNVPDQQGSALICKTQANPFIMTANHLRKRKSALSDVTDANHSAPGVNCTGTWIFPVQPWLNIHQEPIKEERGSLKSNLPSRREGQAAGEDKTRGLSFLSSSIQSDNSGCLARGPSRQPRDAAPVERRRSNVCQTDSPPADANGPPKMNSGFSSITITARRVVRPTQDPSQRDTGPGGGTQPDGGPPATATSYDSPGVVHKRKATIIKVSEYRQSHTIDGPGRKARNPDFRHSYTEGDNKENLLSRSCLTGECKDPPATPRAGAVRSCAHHDVPAKAANSVLYLGKSLSISLPEPESGTGPEVHRSALSLYLSSTATKEDPDGVGAERNGPDGPWGIAGHRTRTWDSSPQRNTAPTVKQQESDLPRYPHAGRTADTPSHFRERDTCHASADSEKPDPHVNDGARFEPGRFSTQTPNLTKPQDRELLQGPRAVPVPHLTLSAASVIANVKRQARMSKNPNGRDSEDLKSHQDSRDSLDAKWSADCERGGRRDPMQSVFTRATTEGPTPRPEEQTEPCADPEDNAPRSLTLREALEIYRPDFINRSRGRVRQLERRALQRRELRGTDTPGTKARLCTKPHPLSDNLFKPRERDISEKEMQQRSKRIYNKLPEVQKKKDEEKKRAVSQTNRLRAELFKKKLLDQILQRNGD